MNFKALQNNGIRCPDKTLLKSSLPPPKKAHNLIILASCGLFSLNFLSIEVHIEP